MSKNSIWPDYEPPTAVEIICNMNAGYCTSQVSIDSTLEDWYIDDIN